MSNEMAPIDPKSQSLERSKATSIKLVTILGKTVASLIPGGSLAADVIETAIGHAVEYRRDEARRRIHELFLCLFKECRTPEEQSKLDEAEFDPDDIMAIMTNAVQDEEFSKVGYYALLLNYFRLHPELDKRLKLHLLKSFKILNVSDLNFTYVVMRLIIEARKEKANGLKSRLPQMSSNAEGQLYRLITNQAQDFLVTLTVNKLKTEGYLKDGEGDMMRIHTKFFEILSEILGRPIIERTQ